MKKTIVLALALSMALAVAGCAKTGEPAAPAATEAVRTTAETAQEESTPAAAVEETTTVAETVTTNSADAAAGVMTYEEYMAADLDSQVVIETYVQAKQSWWEDKATVYSQDKDGAYFLYNMACSEEDYERLVPGTKIRVTGYKSEWSGEIELMDATFEFVEGDEFIADALDVTDMLGTDGLIDHQNQFVTFKGMTVEAAGQDADGNDVALQYYSTGTRPVIKVSQKNAGGIK